MAFYTKLEPVKGTETYEVIIYAHKHYRKGAKVDKNDFYYYNRIATIICLYPRSVASSTDNHRYYVITKGVVLHNIYEVSIEPAKTKGEYFLHFINRGEKIATITLTGSKNNLTMLEDGLRCVGIINNKEVIR